MGLPNHFQTSWHCPTPLSPRGSKPLKPLPGVKWILYCNCFKTNLLPVVWDPQYPEILCFPPPCHASQPSASLNWRVQAFLTISLSSKCWDSSMPLAARLYYHLQVFHGLLRPRDHANTQYNTMLPGFWRCLLALRTNEAVTLICFFPILEAKQPSGLRSQMRNKES